MDPAEAPNQPHDALAPPLTRFATALGGAAVVAALSAGPASVRVAAAGELSQPSAWVALALGGLMPALMLVAVLRSAHLTLRPILAPAPASRILGLALGCVLSFATLVLFGALLRKTTHHFGLAATTFAVGSMLLIAFALVLSLRIAEALARRGRAWVRAGTTATMVAALGLASLACLRVVRGGMGAEWGPWVVDGVMFFTASMFLAHPTFARNRWLSLVGPPALAMLAILGIRVLHGNVGVLAAIAAEAPLFHKVCALFA